MVKVYDSRQSEEPMELKNTLAVLSSQSEVEGTVATITGVLCS